LLIFPSTPDRRQLLAAGGGLVLLSGIAPGALLAQSKFGAYPFTLGVAAGDPLPDGFVIWTRLAPQPRDPHGGMPIRPIDVRWEVAEDEHFARIARSGTATALPELAHSVHVEVSGLQPRRPYWYRFTINGGEQSPVGRVRTAPAPGDLPERVRIGVAGCQNYEAGFFGAYGYLAQEPDLDAIFHYGDYIYVGAGGRGAKVNGTTERVVVRANSGKKVMSLDDFRVRYAEYKLDPDLQAAHHAAAFIPSYDDGEVSDAFAGNYDKFGTPPEIFALHRFAAMQAWYEHMPVRRAQFPNLAGLNAVRRLDYGQLVRLHVLDTRGYRTSPPCIGPEDEGCGRQPDVPQTVLGAAQERWLGEGLVNTARWNLLAQQILVMPFNSGGANGGRIKVGWNPYPEARARLVRQIMERKLTNVVIASGDAHQHFVGTVPVRDAAPDGPAAATEFLATSISSAGDGTPLRPESEQLLRHTPNLSFINAKRGYQLFDITPKEWRTAIKVMDRVQTRGGTLHTEATFAVEPSRPGAHKI
jgi:alkaline phosphatase D